MFQVLEEHSDCHSLCICSVLTPPMMTLNFEITHVKIAIILFG